jgi:ABC-type oligopeptide transport system substrate-binding subunit
MVRWHSSWRVKGVAALGLAIALALLPFPAGAAGDPNKVLRIAFPTAETGFDPVHVSDLYSNTVNEAIFERLLTYDYLARPAKVVPMAAETMPEVKDHGRVYVFRIRKGIYFTPDPAFKGLQRELTAEDFVYSYKRFLDPKNRSPWAFLLEGKIEGLDELAEAAKKSGKFDYDAKVPGMRAVDRYTLEFRLKATDYIFPFVVAHVPFGAVAREVIEAYSDDTQAHPVGTGPYILKQ